MPDLLPGDPLGDLPLAILPQVIAIVETAGSRLAAEFSRPEGPRGQDDKADIDVELELFLRDALLALCPGRFVGEECGIIDAPDAPYCWLVDPQDGTRAFLQGKRGSAVSVALLPQRRARARRRLRPRRPRSRPRYDRLGRRHGPPAAQRREMAHRPVRTRPVARRVRLHVPPLPAPADRQRPARHPRPLHSHALHRLSHGPRGSRRRRRHRLHQRPGRSRLRPPAMRC